MTSNQFGWFDAFRDNGGPVLYTSPNRTPAVEDVRNVLIYITFSTLFIAFLIILPGIRKERLSTFICVTISLFVGAVILIANCGTSWHVAQASISSPYRAFSKEKIFANIGVKIGLQSVNITLRATPFHRRNEEINYNERFYWIGPTDMKQEFQTALAKGLPFSILTIAEYFSQDGEGFCWGRSYRLAGYYANILLWIAFSTWVLMNVLLCAVPRYGAYTMQITGVIMLLTNAIYTLLLPRKPLVIPFEGESLRFTYGWCFWIVLIAGVTSVLVGALVTIVDTMFPNKFSTILEVDYDTPYRYFVGNDAHLIGAPIANCPHNAVSQTSSELTDSTACCDQALGIDGKCRVRLQTALSKTKSDASTSTTLERLDEHNSKNNERVTTTADIETNETNNGFTNDGYQRGDDDEDSDVSTTIIDGKRAISLHNFGKFAAQQQQREQKTGITFRHKNFDLYY